MVAIYFIGGLVTWTFMEYALHGWMGHKARGRNAFSKDHLHHHADPTYFAPTWLKSLLALPVLSATYALFYWAAGFSIATGFVGGWAVMYLTYEVVHRRSHTHPPTGPYSRWVRLNHFNHHFRNANYNHGVTSPVFDYIFGTYKPLERCRVPRKAAIAWLIDPQTDDIREEFQADYYLSKTPNIEP